MSWKVMLWSYSTNMKLCFNVTLAALALRVKALWRGDLALEFIKFVCVGFIKITSPLFTDYWLGRLMMTDPLQEIVKTVQFK